MNSLAKKNARPCIILIFAVLATSAAGCTTTQSVPANATSVSSRLAVGDNISITKRNGDVVKLEVTRITRSGIHGGGQYVAYADMRQIQIREIDGVKTAQSAGAIAVGIVAIKAIAESLGEAVASQSFR